jgi:PAS domain S-box-containing protein
MNSGALPGFAQMDRPQNAQDENRRIRRAMRDLVALSTLPAVWIGFGLDGIARSLADALVTTLSLDLIYIRLSGEVGKGAIEVVRGGRKLDSQQEASAAELLRPLVEHGEGSETSIANPFEGGAFRAVVVRFGIGNDKGAIVACSRDGSFPTEQDRLLLGVGANHTAIVMQRRLAEEELRRSEEELAEFFENATIGLHWVGPDGTILRVNRAELDMLGYTREEYIGHPIADFHVDHDVICDILNKLKCGEKLAEYPARLRCKDGSIKHVLIDSSVMWRNDEFIHTRCFTRDVTERKAAETALADARRQLDAALEAGAIATWTWDIRENRLYADRQLARLFNLPEGEAEGGLLTRYVKSIHPDDVDRVTAALAQSVQTGDEYGADYRVIQADGSLRWASARGRLESDAVGRPLRMLGVVVDITARKLLEEELRVRLAQLAEADRRKDEFLATLAHELRNPLAPIRNSLEIMKMPRLDAATVQRTRDIVERQVHHLVRLVDDLLDVSRVMRGKINLHVEPIEMATVVAQAVEMAQSLIEARGHRLALSLPERSLLVNADSVRLTQVIGNLLTNSAKYTEPNGHIWLSVREDAGEAVINVRDDGIGISSDMLPHVFELFVQADHASTKAAGGLGIGLTLVKNLVQMHGGTVDARSAGLGQGSEFSVRLPLLVGGSNDVSEAIDVSNARDPSKGTLKVLVVDDNIDAAHTLAILLQLQGHQVRVAHDGAAAIAMAESYRPNILFLDLGMPGMDGYEVARRVRKHPDLAGAVLAALTGWGQDDDRRRTAEAGFDHHLVKPPDPDSIIKLLNSLSAAVA